jgi:hypothetical protein
MLCLEGIVAESAVVAFAALAFSPEFAGNKSNLVLFEKVSELSHNSMMNR